MPIPEDATIVVTGASRGLGIEFVKQITTKYPKATLIACVRDPSKSKSNVLEAAAPGTKVHVVGLDADDEKSIKAATEEIGKLSPGGVDVLINNAGINLSPNVNDLETTAEQLSKTFHTNVIGVVLVTEALIPLLRLKNTKIVYNISSWMGSIGNNGGGAMSYRVSKTALNMATHCFAKALASENFIFIPAHPGWVVTDMGGPNATLKPEESIAGMLKVIGGLKVEDNGKFINYDGNEIAW